MTVYQSDGTTLIQVQNANPIGQAEVINNIVRPANGEITLKVDSVTSAFDVQRYRINFGLVPGTVQVQTNLYNLIRGVTVSGNLSSLQNSDDNRLVLRPGIVFTTGQAPVEFVVEGTSSELTPTNLSMKIESSGSSTSLNRTVELYNFDTDVYEQVSSAPMTTSESVLTINVASNSDRFVSASGTIRARIAHKAAGPMFTFPWTISTDHIYWELVP
jgi:hypothetical protein